MLRCMLRESWRQFKESKFFMELSVVCFCFVFLCGITAIGYGLWKLLTWWLGEDVVRLTLVGLGCVVLAVGVGRLLQQGIVAFKEIVAYCRSRQ